MKILLKKWNAFLALMGVEEKDRKLFYFYALGAVIGVFVIQHFPDLLATIPIALFVAITLFVLFMWGYAGIIVFRSVIPTSIALTLLLFLGLEYCGVSPEHRFADESLKFVMGFGLLYVASQFVIALFKELVGSKKAEDEWRKKGVIRTLKEINKGKHEPLMLGTLGFIVMMFTWHFAMIVLAIVQDMCIYN